MKRVIVVAILLLSSTAAADDLGVGLYAPNAPFGGTSARLDYVSRLADHLAAAAGGDGSGRVFAKASDFTAAIKKGEIDVAVVDAGYLAAIGAPYTVVATATRGGETATRWQLVSRGGEDTILELEGKKLLCAGLGGKEDAFVYQALLGGELATGFFEAIDTSPDVVSALAALGLGRADAAVVPGGVELPEGVTRVASLPEVGWPVLIVVGTSTDLRNKLAAAATDFDGGDVLGGFAAGGADAVRALAGRFGKRERRGPMVVPNLRVAVDELVEARKPAIRRVDVRALIAKPAALPPPGK
jgi:hypothetical protein